MVGIYGPSCWGWVGCSACAQADRGEQGGVGWVGVRLGGVKEEESG